MLKSVSLISFSIGLLGMAATPVQASLRQYHSTVESSQWLLSEQTRLSCTLSHALPGYGEAQFTSEASKQLNMEFVLDMNLLPKKFGCGTLPTFIF